VLGVECVHGARQRADRTNVVDEYGERLVVPRPSPTAIRNCAFEESAAHAVRERFGDPVDVRARHFGTNHNNMFANDTRIVSWVFEATLVISASTGRIRATGDSAFTIDL
jgi:hypothetical protein